MITHDSGRVDAWDEDEDEEDNGWAAPGWSSPAWPSHVEAAGNADPDEGAPPEPSLREMLRGAPIWIWLISGVSLAAICAMMFTVLLLAASFR